MKIILTQNVPNLGSLGDEVQVKDGYARNFLLPQGMAMPAGGKNAREIQHRQHFLGKQRAEAIEAAQGESDKVAALELTVKVRAGTGGRLFGSVTNRDLQALIAEQGFELDRKAIQLHTPVKSLGTFGATIKLHTEVKVELQFKVVPSEVVETSPGEEGGDSAGETPEGEGLESTEGGTKDGAEEGTEDGTEDGTEKPTKDATEDGSEDAAGVGTPPPAALEPSETTGEASEHPAVSATENPTENNAENNSEKSKGSTPETPSGKSGDAAGGASGGSPEAEA